MKERGAFRSILLGHGSPFVGFVASLVLIFVFLLFPWVTASRGYITFCDHYMYYAVTARLIQLLFTMGASEAAVFFLIELIALPLGMFLTFLNRPVLSGILLLVTGLCFICVFIVANPTMAMDSVMQEWEHSFHYIPFPEDVTFARPYYVGVGTYVIIITGICLIFSGYFYQRTMRQTRREFLSHLRERSK